MGSNGHFTYEGYQTNNHAALYNHFPDRVAGTLAQYSDKIVKLKGENVLNTQTNVRGGGGRATVEIWYVNEYVEQTKSGTKATQQDKKAIKRVFNELNYELKPVGGGNDHQKFVYQGGKF